DQDRRQGERHDQGGHPQSNPHEALAAQRVHTPAAPAANTPAILSACVGDGCEGGGWPIVRTNRTFRRRIELMLRTIREGPGVRPVPSVPGWVGGRSGPEAGAAVQRTERAPGWPGPVATRATRGSPRAAPGRSPTL